MFHYVRWQLGRGGLVVPPVPVEPVPTNCLSKLGCDLPGAYPSVSRSGSSRVSEAHLSGQFAIDESELHFRVGDDDVAVHSVVAGETVDG